MCLLFFFLIPSITRETDTNKIWLVLQNSILEWKNLPKPIVFCCYNCLDLPRKNFEHDANLDNYSNRMFFLIFLELHLLDLCVDMAESFSKWLFNRSVWKIFLTCEEKYFSSHVMDFSVKKKIEVLTKRSQQVRNNKEN